MQLSSYGRLGLLVHVTAGFIDPGFRGQLTLEFYNVSISPIALVPGIKICQVCVLPIFGIVERPYGSKPLNSHYQGQFGVTPFCR